MPDVNDTQSLPVSTSSSPPSNASSIAPSQTSSPFGTRPHEAANQLPGRSMAPHISLSHRPGPFPGAAARGAALTRPRVGAYGVGSHLGSPRPPRKDKIIQSTDVDALSSKYSAFMKGYIQDPFLQPIVDGLKKQGGPRENVASSFIAKFPVINIGSYIRNYAINTVLDLMIESIPQHTKCQVISLGAGSDTRPFNTFQKYGSDRIIYHEIDFSVSTTKKAHTIINTHEISELLWPNGQLNNQDKEKIIDEIHTPHYHLHAKDLRTITATTPLFQGMDSSLPTFIISECCLCYLQPDESDAVLQWLTDNLTNGRAIAVYEPIGGHDSFGKVMIENLASRGISLPTLHKFPTLESQAKRLADRGFTDNSGIAAAADIWSMYETWIPAEEKARIGDLEVLDEIEELALLLQHYCISWAVSDPHVNSKWVAAYKKLPHKVVVTST